MKSLVIYDSNYGNTKRIAESIARGLENDTAIRSVGNLLISDLKDVNLLVVGSPIIAWRPTVQLTAFLNELPENALAGKKVAAFDTRVRLFIHGNAARRIAAMLTSKGGQLITAPVGFDVKGKEGPLFEGETERAEAWAQTIRKAAGL